MFAHMKHGSTKNAFWDVNNKKYRKWCSLFNLFYLITLMAYLCSQRTTNVQIKYFMFDWSIYRLFVPNTAWKRDSLQIMIFVNVSSSWSMFQLKTRFETWITRNDVNGVSLLYLSYLLTLMVYLCSQWAPNVQITYFMVHWSIYSLFVLNRGWKPDHFQIMIFVYVCSTWSIVELKTRFETRITRNDVNGVSLFHLPYLITLMVYLCSQTTPNAQIKFLMFDWSIYRLFVLNRGWKPDYFQIMIFVNVCSTWSIVELKARFETWITRNDINGVRLFHLSCLITLMVYLCSQLTPNVQIKFFRFDWWIYSLFVPNTYWKRDSLQIMIFVNVCSTWRMVQLKTRFETWITRNDVNGVFVSPFLFNNTYGSQWTPNVQI
jgi:hypothetical protein